MRWRNGRGGFEMMAEGGVKPGEISGNRVGRDAVLRQPSDVGLQLGSAGAAAGVQLQFLTEALKLAIVRTIIGPRFGGIDMGL